VGGSRTPPGNASHTPPENGRNNGKSPGKEQSSPDVGDDTIPPWRESGLKKRAKDNIRREREELRPGSQNKGRKASTGVAARSWETETRDDEKELTQPLSGTTKTLTGLLDAVAAVSPLIGGIGIIFGFEGMST
jgi:hypothetical protein